MEPLDFEQYRALVEHSPTMVWRTGLDGKCDYVNAAWLAYTGHSLGGHVGHAWVEGIHPDDCDRCLALYLEHFERREPFEMEYRLRRHDGAHRHVLDRGVPYKGADGAFAGFLGSRIDVDDRRNREVVSGAAEFLEMSLDNLCVAGFDGYFKRVNPSWTKTLGWTSEELLSRPSIEFVHPDDRAATVAARAQLKGGLPLTALVNRYRCKDETSRWFDWRSVAHTEQRLVYAVARDVTEQKLQENLQRQLMVADRMASVGTLAAGVAHEINNPLSYVLANLDMLIEEIGAHSESASPRMAEWAQMALEARHGSERIRKIVGGLKTFSRAEAALSAVIDVRTVLEMSINMTFNEIKHRARLVKSYGEIPFVEADEARLGQVFINLLVNAAQALPDGGTEANEIRIVTSTDAQGRAAIEVRDTGPGIPASLLARVFDPFFTTKPIGFGTGLGLSICHNIVASMGGEISARNQEGGGTTFRVVLPGVSRSIQKATAPIGKDDAARASRATVLIVDDERAVGLVLQRVLRDHDVTIVTTAKEALDLVVSGTPFDIILSDLMMPEMSGMDLYDELARRCPSAAKSMVFITGGAFTAAGHAFLDRVPNQRMQKPFDTTAVRTLVEHFVKREH